MQKQLIIFLNAHDLERPSWLVVESAEQTILERVRQGNPACLAELARDSHVIVFVPAEFVMLTQVQLPKMNRARIYQALPFAIEEALIDDVETLHFAIGHQDSTGNLPVAITSHAAMQQWLMILESWAIKPNVFYSMVMALPPCDATWQVAITDLALVRMGKAKGFACDLINLSEMLRLALSTELSPPTAISIHNYSDKPMQAHLNVMLAAAEEMKPSLDFFDNAIAQINTEDALNLLQGPYAVKKSKRRSEVKLKKFAICSGVAALVLLFAGPIVSYIILKQRINIVNEQIADIYKANFPQAKSIVAPKLRMQEKFQKMTAQSGGNQLLVLLGEVSEAMSTVKNIKLKRLDFQNNQLTLALKANSSEDFSHFTDYLQRQGLKVKQQNADLSGTVVDATLLIE